MPEISEEQLAVYEGLAAQNKTLLGQVKTLQEQATAAAGLQTQAEALVAEKTSLEQRIGELTGQITQRDIGAALDSALGAAGVLPQYSQLFQAEASKLKLEGNQVLTPDGKPLSELANTLKTQYPAMFAAVTPTGGAAPGSNGATPTGSSSKLIKPENGVIVGVSPDDLISGAVKVEV